MSLKRLFRHLSLYNEVFRLVLLIKKGDGNNGSGRQKYC